MPSEAPEQPSHRTVIGLVLHYALYIGIGYLAYGAIGAWCGAGLATVLYVRMILRAIRSG